MAQLDKRALKDNAVDGAKIRLLNDQAVRARNAADNADVQLFKLNASNEWTFIAVPKISGSNVTTESYVTSAVATEASARSSADTTLQNNIDSEASTRASADTTLQNNIDSEASTRASADTTLQNNIDAEESARIAADAALQTSIDAAVSDLNWKPLIKLLSTDAELVGAVEGDILEDILPLSDDDTPLMVIGDFEVGDLLMTKEASPKIFKVYDDAGTLKVTLVGVEQPAAGDTWVVANDLPDSPGSQEGRAIWHFDGAALIKIGDFDWSMANGIDISGDYATLSGNVLEGDTVEQAIGKVEKKADDANDRIDNLTTDDVAEGANLYFTDSRAKTAAVVNSLAGSETDQAPSVQAVKDYVAANAATVAVETFTLSSGDISNGYVDLADEAAVVIEVTPKGFPPQHPVDDYTLSLEGGVTRVTFAGDMLSLVAGDKLKVAYSV